MSTAQTVDFRDRNLSGIFAKNGWIIFLILIALCSLDVFLLYKKVLGGNEIYYQSFGDKVTFESIRQGVEEGRRWEWTTYLSVPLTILVRVAFTAFCLNIGALFIGKKVGFKKFFKISLIADLTVAAKLFTKSLLLITVMKPETVFEVHAFSPFSLLSLLGADNVDTYFYYPLQTLNLFEVAYWLVLALGVRQLFKNSLGKSFGFVMGTYGVGLFVLMVIVVFLTINLIG